MKIGITCYPTYGGSGVVATELGIELAVRGHDIHFITYSQPFRLTGREANIHFHEVAVSNYPLFEHPPYDLALATRMAEVAEFYSPYLRNHPREAFNLDPDIEVIRNFVTCDVYIRNPELVAAMRPRFAEPNERLL